MKFAQFGRPFSRVSSTAETAIEFTLDSEGRTYQLVIVRQQYSIDEDKWTLHFRGKDD